MKSAVMVGRTLLCLGAVCLVPVAQVWAQSAPLDAPGASEVAVATPVPPRPAPDAATLVEVAVPEPVEPPEAAKPLWVAPRPAEDAQDLSLRGMRMALTLSRRPVVAADGFGADAARPIEAEPNELPRRWGVDPAESTLSQVLARWTHAVGWQLLWEADRDFLVDAKVEFHTTFKSALEIVMLSLAESEYPLQARLNKEARILRVTRYMDSRSR